MHFSPVLGLLDGHSAVHVACDMAPGSRASGGFPQCFFPVTASLEMHVTLTS